jgi:asparagine N-glycosylation enzyme membrane subunit Stt3
MFKKLVVLGATLLTLGLFLLEFSHRYLEGLMVGTIGVFLLMLGLFSALAKTITERKLQQ